MLQETGGWEDTQSEGSCIGSNLHVSTTALEMLSLVMVVPDEEADLDE